MAYDTPNRSISASAVDTIALGLRPALARRLPPYPPPPASERCLSRCVCASAKGIPLSAAAVDTATGKKQISDANSSTAGITRPGR
jgi:hypothetical protein